MRERSRTVLVLMGGLPGVGKSAIADELGRMLPAAVLSVDEIEDAIIGSGISMSFETGLAAYRVGAAIARRHLASGQHVIADAANYIDAGRDIWRDAAGAVGARVVAIEVTCSDEALHRQRLLSRRRGLAHYPEPSWGDVVARRVLTTPWSISPLLTVDSVRPLHELVNVCASFVGGHDHHT